MSNMTGEALPVERQACLSSTKETVLNHANICLMVGVSVAASAVVISGTSESFADWNNFVNNLICFCRIPQLLGKHPAYKGCVILWCRAPLWCPGAAREW